MTFSWAREKEKMKKLEQVERQKLIARVVDVCFVLVLYHHGRHSRFAFSKRSAADKSLAHAEHSQYHKDE